MVLRPIYRAVARMLLDGGTPRELSFAAGYPSRFSREVMESVVETTQPGRFGPYFIIRKADTVVVGEIGCTLDLDAGTGRVGYTVVEPCWGRGYATEALRALLTHVLAEPDVYRVVAETMVEHAASRRVMEKAGMHYCGRRLEADGDESMDLVVYQVLAGNALPTS